MVEEQKRKLHTMMKDEVSDYSDKNALAYELKHNGCDVEAFLLYRMADDEREHAVHLKKILDEQGYELPASDENELNKMESRFCTKL